MILVPLLRRKSSSIEAVLESLSVFPGRQCSYYINTRVSFVGRVTRYPVLLNLERFVDCVWNVMAHAQKPDFVFRRNWRVHLNRRGCQFSRLLAAEVCTSAVVMMDAPCSEVVWRVLVTQLHSPVSPSLPLPCVTLCRQVSTGLYLSCCSEKLQTDLKSSKYN